MTEKIARVKAVFVDPTINSAYSSLNDEGRQLAENLKERYLELVSDGRVQSDPGQLAALHQLGLVQAALTAPVSGGTGLLSKLRKRPALTLAGLYLWGGVGTGKSMLMDLFFTTTKIKKKRRVHFHAFMQEIHGAIHQARQTGTRDPIQTVANIVAKDARLLCFDELQITDITDAMIVGRLFECLFNAGTVIVITSNRIPDDLYKNGLNRQLFLPFIELIAAQMTIHHMAGSLDYRLDRLRGMQTWFTPVSTETTQALNALWDDLVREECGPLTLIVNKRALVLSCFVNGNARASFAELCQQPLGPADYLAVAKSIRLLMLEDIPVLSRANNNEAKRFVTLIDTLYEARVQLICSADAAPENLYLDGPGAFEFERTASRLTEMQSADWAQPE